MCVGLYCLTRSTWKGPGAGDGGRGEEEEERQRRCLRGLVLGSRRAGARSLGCKTSETRLFAIIIGQRAAGGLLCASLVPGAQAKCGRDWGRGVLPVSQGPLLPKDGLRHRHAHHPSVYLPDPRVGASFWHFGGQQLAGAGTGHCQWCSRFAVEAAYTLLTKDKMRDRYVMAKLKHSQTETLTQRTFTPMHTRQCTPVAAPFSSGNAARRAVGLSTIVW